MNRAGHKRSLQTVKNTAWNLACILNDPEYHYGAVRDLKTLLRFCIFVRILSRYHIDLPIRIERTKYRIAYILLLPVACVLAPYYVKKRVQIDET